MIASWKDRRLRNFFVEGTRYAKVPADLEHRLRRKLQMLDDATADADLRSPPSNHFERLQGALEGLCSIRVNEQWRLVFAWDGSAASDVALDNHSYR